jgi:hypothetical protein
MISPLNDVALAALCVAGLATWLIQKEEQTPIYASLFMTGIFSGLACGVKFPGMVWASTLALMIVADTFNDPSLSFRPKFLLKKTSVALFIYTATLLISGGFWYSRAAVLTGNPVHPYFRETFGGHGLDEVLAEDRKTPVQMVLNILTAPVMMVFAPSSFDSFSHQVGPVFLALIPLGLFLGMPWPWYRLVAVGWLVMALCLTQRQSPRFYISMLGPWSAASAVVAFHLQQNVRYQMGRWSFPVASAIVMSLTCLTTLFNLIRTKTSVAMLAGLISPSQWLIENEPTVQIGHWVDANLPKEAKLIGQDHRAFYWPRPFTMEKAHRRRLALLEAKPISNEVIQHFMDSGFTHLVLAEPMPIEAVEFDPALSLHLESWIASHQPILDTTVQEHDGFARRYRIFALDDSKANWPDTLQWAENGSILSDPELQRSSFSSETFISPPEIHP